MMWKRGSFSLAFLVWLLVLPPAQGAFRYADDVTTTGGQFGASYPPTNLINNGFTSPANTIDTTTTYAASGNNYATANGTTANFNLTFNFNVAVDLSAMYVWNYVYRTAAGVGATTPGVNAYTLTFYSAPDGGGSVVGSFSGSLVAATFNAVNSAQTVNFGTTNIAVRSVVMHVVSNYGATYAGMNELAFETTGTDAPTAILSFATSTNLVTYGNMARLIWQVGAVTNLVIDNGIGDVLNLTTNGSGSVEIAPTHGYATYTLTANGVESNSVSVIGLPAKEKLHIYLLIGQSNMEGHGTYLNPLLDAPLPKVLQFGSRDGMESVFAEAQHPLTSLTAGGNEIGMGLEFAKTMLASNSDPDVVICLINHALGATAIQWWAPGAITTKGASHHLYDEAVQRATNAAAYGVIKGVLWHQGEYNSSGSNSNPSPEPELYAQRLSALVANLRNDLGVPGLPFVCGKFVPPWTNSSGTAFTIPSLTQRDIVEAALMDLTNQQANTACVDNTGLIGREDQTVHFDAASQRELGRRYAQKMLAMYADPYRLYLGGFYTPTQLTNAALTDPQSDNDLDGEPNYMEYAFNTRPNDAASVAHFRGAWYATNILGTNLSYPAVVFPERVDTEAPGYTVEVSNDLLNWRTNQTGLPPETIMVEPSVLNTNGTQSVTVRYHQAVQDGFDRIFLRLRISPP